MCQGRHQLCNTTQSWSVMHRVQVERQGDERLRFQPVKERPAGGVSRSTAHRKGVRATFGRRSPRTITWPVLRGMRIVGEQDFRSSVTPQMEQMVRVREPGSREWNSTRLTLSQCCFFGNDLRLTASYAARTAGHSTQIIQPGGSLNCNHQGAHPCVLDDSSRLRKAHGKDGVF
jgi:hypothetical protein